MKNTLRFKVDRFADMKKVLAFGENSDIKSLKVKDVGDLLDFANSRFINTGRKYCEDVLNLYCAVKGQKHSEFSISNILQCIRCYEEWISGMIKDFENFNN